MMRADLGPVVSKAQEDPAGALRASAPEPLPSLAPAQGEPVGCRSRLYPHVASWHVQTLNACGVSALRLQGLTPAGCGAAVCSRGRSDLRCLPVLLSRAGAYLPLPSLAHWLLPGPGCKCKYLSKPCLVSLLPRMQAVRCGYHRRPAVRHAACGLLVTLLAMHAGAAFAGLGFAEEPKYSEDDAFSAYRKSRSGAYREFMGRSAAATSAAASSAPS